MSSASSFSTSRSKTFSIYTSDENAPPPSYNQVIQMNNPTAPLLSETFTSSIFGTTTRLQFEWNTGYASQYSFLIRDTAGCLQARGEVSNLDTTLRNINGTEMLKIRKNTDVIRVNGLAHHVFDVYNNNAHIGFVKYAHKASAENCLKISHKNSNSQIIVRSLKLGDFAIFRDRTSSSPICNIQIPNGDVYRLNDFDGTIIFHPQSEITTREQLLCTAAAIAFKVQLKELTATENADETVLVYCMAFVCIAIIIGVGVIAFFALEKWGCESKKSRGFAGYQNRIC